jgi:signal transduction histidine kinase
MSQDEGNWAAGKQGWIYGNSITMLTHGVPGAAMTDPRLKVYREAALAMADGVYRQDFPPGPADEVGRLGEALASLGRTLEQRSGELLTLPKVAERINAGLLLDEVMDKAYLALRTLVPYDRMSLALMDRDGRELTVRWVRTEAPRTFLDVGTWRPVAGSSLEDLLVSRQPRIRNDLPGHLAGHPQSEATRLLVAEGMRSDLACPLAVRNRLVGLLFCSSMAPDAYRRSHQVILGQLAGPLALIIEKSRLYQDLQERSELRGRLLAGAGPALVGPLDRVLGLLEQLDGEGSGCLNVSQRDLVRRALAGQTELAERVRDLLGDAALGAAGVEGQRQPTDLRLLLEAVGRAHREAAEGSIRLAVEGAPGDATIPAEPRLLARALEALAGHLLRRSAPGGRITLAWRLLDGYAQVRVAAPDLGLARDQLPGLYTLAGPEGPGEDPAGFALALARRIVEAHGGHLRADSSLEAGTTFTVWLPR